MTIIIMGPQGSGKTTQAERLATAFNIPHLESGEVFREIAKQDSDLGREVQAALEQGHLVDRATADLVIESMFERAKYHDHVIVDGFPRDVVQAQQHKGKIDRVFYLDVGEEECIKRLASRGRADDTPEIIKERLRLYYERTVPVLEYFERLAILEKIDGERDVNVIYQDLYGRIKRMLQIGDAELLK
ncbi:MAG: nucleoside monophosphate kinase [bacterium]|nr:nucleoside monophosphate kinase [bacterium]